MAVIIKSPAEIEAMKEAGRVSAKVLRMLGDLIEPGISTLELDHQAEAIIRMEGGRPAFKGYYGFPGSICASINDTIVHGIPSKDIILQEGDIISVDTGAIIDGWVGDNAYTYLCGEVDPEVVKLCKVTEESMWAGISKAVPDGRLGDIGYAVQSIAEAAGFKVVREYVGHGVGRNMHEDPNVPNYGKAGKGLRLMEGMVIAIEPMVNMKSHRTKRMKDGWTVKTVDGLPSAHYEKTVAITADGPLILTQE
ncbi:MAG: type I methionyl aminopeptidase [Coriobacteriales bacterium]|nr:type I methionyl aminopeptidase [Coriobacteriales bacterium]